MTLSTALMVVGLLATVYVCNAAAKALVRAENRRIERDEQTIQRRRFTDPQRGAANGTGVERPSPHRADALALPRSPQTPVDAVDPRPMASTGPSTPVAVPTAALGAVTGFQRETVHG